MSLDINKHVCEYICVCIYIYVGNNSITTIHAGHYLSDKVYTHTHTPMPKNIEHIVEKDCSMIPPQHQKR